MADVITGDPDKTALFISECRYRTGLAQQRFADAIGAKASSVRAWEKARRSPRGTTAKLLIYLSDHPGLINELAQIDVRDGDIATA